MFSLRDWDFLLLGKTEGLAVCLTFVDEQLSLLMRHPREIWRSSISRRVCLEIKLTHTFSFPSLAAIFKWCLIDSNRLHLSCIGFYHSKAADHINP